MQCPSNLKTYVFRSIFLPYFSTSTSPSTSSVRQYTTAAAAAAAINQTTSIQCRLTHSRSTAKGTSKHPTPSSFYNRSISTLQHVRGHDPPQIDKQTIAQKRTREYLGFVNQDNIKRDQLSSQAKTSVRALEKILQSYGSNGRDPKAGSISKGKAREEIIENGSTFNTSIQRDNVSVTWASTPSSSAFQLQQPPQKTSSKISTVQESISNITPHLSSTTTSSHLLKSTQNNSPITSFPPTIQRLLSARLFRLAVFHILSTPEYATDRSIILGIAGHLEQKGAGKLASRLRRGWENSRDLSVSTSDTPEEGKYIDGSGKRPISKLRLHSDPKSNDKPKERLPPNYWQIPIVPPSKPPSDPSSNSTKEERLTEYYNAHLEFQLKKPLFSSVSSRCVTSSSISNLNDWPHASTNLNQLRKLLSTIVKLERTRGFKPDRKTGNLIIRCWLRSMIPSPSSHNGEKEVQYREYKDRYGHNKFARKQSSDKRSLGVKEIRGLFELLSRIIVSTRTPGISIKPTTPHVENTYTDHPSPHFTHSSSHLSDRSANPENMKEYEEIVRPFGKNMIRSMKNLGDLKGVDMVKQWMKEQREVLLKDGDR
ncbi:uncharacterized protein L199_006854 [Kwoniella botswanensis]|uniref:uncharacterized protein n=1 Tax=Kwoniella botswanensis TaxID=1268659 RepID=UPI00315DBECC